MKLQRAFFLVIALLFLVGFSVTVSQSNKTDNQAAVGSASVPSVDKLSLLDTASGSPVSDLVPGTSFVATGTTSTVTVGATTSGTVASVKFVLDNGAPVIDNAAPFTLGTPIGSGSHTITVTAWTISRARGTSSEPVTAQFTVDGVTTPSASTPTTDISTHQTSPATLVTPSSQTAATSSLAPLAITSFTLVNADTNQDIMTLSDNQTVDVTTLPTQNVTIRANTSAAPLPGSVRYTLNENTNYVTDNLWPFNINASSNTDDYLPWTYALDTDYTLIATPFQFTRARGEVGTSLAIRIKFVSSGAPSTSNRAPVVIPTIACLNATVVNNPTLYGAANPGSISISWDAISSYPNYKAWRIQNGTALDSFEGTGTGISMSYLNPGTWTIQVAVLNGTPNTGATYGPTADIGNLVVSATGPASSTSSTCVVTHNPTTSISMTAPTTNANILVNTPTTFSVVGAPSNDQIARVEYFYRGEFGSVSLGSTSVAPFSLTASLPSRGFACPTIQAVATLLDGSKLKTTKRYLIVTDTAATAPTASCPNNSEVNDNFDINSPVQGTVVNAGQMFTISTTFSPSSVPINYVSFYELGGNVSQNLTNGSGAYTVTSIGKRTSPPYSISYAVSTPGNIGSSDGTTNIIQAVAFYANGATNISTVPIKVLPAANLPTVSALSVVNPAGSTLMNLPIGGAAQSLNIGTQAAGALGPNISIKATAGSVVPTSVKFSLTGPTGFTAYTLCEGAAPFALYGDAGGVYNTWPTSTEILGGYTLTVTPYSAAGCTTASAGTPVTVQFTLSNLDDTTPPTQPTGVSVYYRSGTEIRVSWTASSATDHNHYVIYRTPSGAPFPVTLGNVTTYTDTSVTSSGAYTYNVTDVDNVGNQSGFSSNAAAPTLSTAFATGNSVSLTAASYSPKTAPDGGNATGAPQVSGAIGGISSGPIYYNGTSYWNVNFTTGTDGWVAESSLALADTTPPTAPTLSVSGVTSSSVSLSWSGATDTGTGVATYSIYKNGGGTPLASVNAATTTSYTDSGLSASTAYTYTVKAVDGAGNTSPASNQVTGTTSSVTASSCTPGTVPNTNGSNRSVELSSSVSTSPASITLCWSPITGRTVTGSITVARKADYDSTSWTTLTSSLAASSTSYTDTTAVVGTYYEYKVSFSQTSTSSPGGGYTHNTSGTATGYIATGINVPLESYKGKIILVVDNTFQTALASQLQTLIDDLNGDRWAVLPLYVNRTDTAASVRSQIINLYNTNQNVKAVYLLGHVPVDSSNTMAPDGHSARAWSSDAYYGEMGTYGATVSQDLEVGRVDAYQMPAFGGTETSMLSAYLTKVSDFKNKVFTPTQRAIVRDGFNAGYNVSLNWPNGSLPWATFPSLVGASNVTSNNVFSPLFVDTLNGQSYEFAYAIAGGQCIQDNDSAIGSTVGLAGSSYGGVFNITGGSYFGNWNNCGETTSGDTNNNFLKAFIFSGKGMVNLYAPNRHWYLHAMAMGQNVGYSTLKSTNNTGVYTPIGGIWDTSYTTNAYMSPLGDPTLRMTYFAKPGSLSATNSGGVTAFSWPAVSGAEGYNVYEIQANTVQANTVRKLNSSLITGTSYTSSDTFVGGKKYMVTAVDLTTSGSGGTYFNESLGRITTTTGQAQQDTTAPSAPAGLVSTSQTTSSIVLDWSDSTGNPVGESVFYKVFRNSGGSTTINETTPIATGLTASTYTDSSLSASTTYQYKVSAYDAAGNESTHTPTSGYGATTATPPDTTAPSVPTGLSVTATTSGTASLSWTASTDAVGVTGYKIFRSTSSTGTYTQVGSSASVTYTDTGLTASTTYYYKVSAYDAAGNDSAQTAVASGTTLAAAVTGQVAGLLGGVGPDNSEDVTPTANPYGVQDYFIDCVSGNDSNNGTTAATPWKTLNKFNTAASSSLQPGARVFFKRGTPSPVCRGTGVSDTYGGTLWINPSGTSARPIEYRAYGSGAAPVISGAVLAGTWTVDSGNIYKTNIGANRPVKYLFVGGSAQTLARTPNKDASGNTVWNYTDDQNGVSGGAYITDSALPTPAANNLVGGRLLRRYSNFNYDLGTITAHSGTTVTVSSPGTQCYIEHCGSSIYPAAGWGYLVENDKELLDQAGEWYYNTTTGDLYFWAPGNVNPNTLTVDIVVDKHAVYIADGKHDILFKNLIFEKYGSDAIYIGDDSGNPAVISNIKFTNDEIRYSFSGIKNGMNTLSASNANTFSSNYLHDLYNVGIWNDGNGQLYQGNVLENIAMDPDMGADTSLWAYFGFRSIGGSTNFISNIVRNIGYIGIEYFGNGEIRGNLVENASAELNDGCGICINKTTSGSVIKRNIVRNLYGNVENVPTTFIHASAISSAISTGDLDNKNTVIEENVVSDFGNTGIALDNNYGSTGIIVRNNTVYTAQPGNATGAAGLKFMDQSVGVVDNGVAPCSTSNFGCFVSNFNHQIYTNNIYMLSPLTHGMYFYQGLTNAAGALADFGSFYGNYIFDPYRFDNITEKRPSGLKSGDIAEVIPNPSGGGTWTVNIYSSSGATSVVGSHTTGDNAVISNRTLGAGGNYWWQVDFTTGVDGWVQEYALQLASKTVAEWQTYAQEPPSAQASNPNRSSGYLIANQSNFPALYLNETYSPVTVTIGSGKCDKNKAPLASTVTLQNFADVVVPERCSDQP
jgi:hypothetical protein